MGRNFKAAKLTTSSIVNLFTSKEKNIIKGTISASIFLALLDMIAIYIFYQATTIVTAKGNLKSNFLTQLIQKNQLTFVVIAIGLFISKTFFNLLLTKITSNFLAKFETRISKDILSKTIEAPINVIDRWSENKAIHLMLNSGPSLTNLALGFVTILSEFALIVILSLFSIFIDPIASLSIILSLIFSVLALDQIIKNKAKQYSKIRNDALSANLKLITEAIHGVREIKLQNSSNQVLKTTLEDNKRLAVSSNKLTYLTQLSRFGLEFALIGSVIVFALISIIFSRVENAYSSVALLMALGFRLLPSFIRMQGNRIAIQQNLPTINELISYLNAIDFENKLFEKRITNLKLISNEIAKPSDGLKFSEISFSYDNFKVLENINFQTNKTGLVCLIGPSGSGKSTLIDLISTLRLPDNGEIFWNSEPIHKNTEEWISHLSLVPQFPRIFTGTLEQNITLNFNKIEVFHDQLNFALKNSLLEEWISSIPDGLQTLVDRDGNSFSGGQRQRIALARALYRKSQLIILDEATSALDVISEAKIIETLDRLRHSQLVFAVSHRLQLVKSADLVIYLENGRIKSQGKYLEILNKIPKLAEISELQ